MQTPGIPDTWLEFESTSLLRKQISSQVANSKGEAILHSNTKQKPFFPIVGTTRPLC